MSKVKALFPSSCLLWRPIRQSIRNRQGLGAVAPVDRAIVVDIVAAGEDGIEARAERDEGPDPAAHLDPPGIRLDEAVEHLEQGGLAGAVAPAQSQALSAF